METMTEIQIFFKILSLAFSSIIPVSFPLVEASSKNSIGRVENMVNVSTAEGKDFSLPTKNGCSGYDT